jgi:hypothetical protein
MFSRKLLLALLAVILCVSGCESRAPRWWEQSPSFPLPASPSPTPAPTAVTAIHVAFEPAVLNGGGTSRATVTLSIPSPDSGTIVQLASNNAAAHVPATVMVPGGMRSTSFSVATQSVPQDVSVEITGMVGNVSGKAVLGVYALLPNSFTWISDPADPLWRGQHGRHTADNASFLARCERDELWVQIMSRVSSGQLIHLGAPRGTPLRPGTYEGAVRTVSRSGTQPGIDIAINGTGCSNRYAGRFVVTEADFSATGQVRRFVATFEQFCLNSPTPVRGELRLTGTPAPFAASCIR